MNATGLAMKLHAGQKDKAGRPYCDHCCRVADYLVRRWPNASQAEREAAWLHDVLEDTDATAASLLDAGVSFRTVAMVQGLTRPPGVAYGDWIKSLPEWGIEVIRVKLADLADNSDPKRLPLPEGFRERVRTRYAPAASYLEAALADLERQAALAGAEGVSDGCDV